MIQCWKATNAQVPSKFYFYNGDTALFPSSCELRAEINGTWELTLKQPVLPDKRFTFIEPGGILQVPSFNGRQYFKIIKTELTETEITAWAYPIFLDAMNWVFIPELVIKNLTAADAAEKINEFVSNDIPYPYTIRCDMTDKKASMNLKLVNMIMAINGDSEDSQSLVNTFGGQVIYDNFDCKISKTAGEDKGVQFRYGKNITGIKRTVSNENLTTRVIPVSADGYIISDGPIYVDVAGDEYTGLPYTRCVEFEDTKLAADSPEVRDFMLQQWPFDLVLNEMLKGNNITEPEVEYEVDLAMIGHSEEYLNSGIVETLALGDIITIKDELLEINSKAQIISMTYDCIKEQPSAITIGPLKQNYFKLNSLRTIGKEIKSYAIKEVSTDGSKVLWKGFERMPDTTSITLSEKISEQKAGILLEWQLAADGNSKPYGDSAFQVIPKGKRGTCVFDSATVIFSTICGKRIEVVDDTTIRGSEYNYYTGTSNGITYSNNRLVLVAVYGI